MGGEEDTRGRARVLTPVEKALVGIFVSVAAVLMLVKSELLEPTIVSGKSSPGAPPQQRARRGGNSALECAPSYHQVLDDEWRDVQNMRAGPDRKRAGDVAQTGQCSVRNTKYACACAHDSMFRIRACCLAQEEFVETGVGGGGWYRFATGRVIPSVAPERNRCGTSGPGWLSAWPPGKPGIPPDYGEPGNLHVTRKGGKRRYTACFSHGTHRTCVKHATVEVMRCAGSAQVCTASCSLSSPIHPGSETATTNNVPTHT
jgi:hypothetical protein